MGSAESSDGDAFGRRRRALEPGQRDVLERIARGAPLPELLEQIVRLIEGVADGAIGSIVLLDRDGLHIRHGAGARLPEAFRKALDGARIGPKEGSCGAAAFSKVRVIAEDLATHPNWAAYRELAHRFDLRACWSSPIFGAHGDVLGTFAIYYREPRGPAEGDLAVIDVATHLASIAIERARAEDDLRASEARYREIYQAVTDVVFHVAVDAEGDFRFAAINPAFTRATGLSEARVTGRRVEDVIPPGSYDLVRASYQRAIAERRTVTWEEVSDYPTGRKYGDVSVTPLFDSDGRCTRLVGTVHDTTRHKVAEMRLTEQAALLDKAHDAILVLGLDDTVRYWNAGAYRLFGFTSDEAVGRRFGELVDPDGELGRVHEGALRRDGESTSEVCRVTRTRERRIVESSATLIRNGNGTPVSVLVIETDITERKALETKLQRAQRIESLGTLAGGIAHDFNNILTAILAHADIASHELAPDHPSRGAVVEIEKAASRAADLTRRMLTFSRGHDSTRVLLDLREPLIEAIALLRPTLPVRVVLHTDIADPVPRVLADATEMHQVLMNLGTNAAQAIGDRPGFIGISLDVVAIDAPRSVTTGSVAPGRYVVLTVRDDGVGMDRSTIDRIFEPYFTTKSARGTGLGLSVVHGIVANHDGEIDVQSEKGAGTTFRVYFPVPLSVRAT